ncbi:MAG: septum formation initiator family protein [Atopobiaceae bacterium]|nr:septum formation initiator family protein [Atopobiaceae bacterium]
MSSYDVEHNRRTRRRSRVDDSSSGRRVSERDARRAQRTRRRTSRSVGADVLSFPASRALGVDERGRRPRGRGETVRRASQTYTGTRTNEPGFTARPAVYTAETRKTRRSRTNTKATIGRTPVIIATVLVAIAIAMGLVMGPARAYYLAWREAGVLQVEYEVLEQQNKELDHEIDRLQTLEGIEDEARRRGYVYPNEEALVADGVEEEKMADPDQVEAAINSYEESLPWYVHVLDSVFGYTRD